MSSRGLRKKRGIAASLHQRCSIWSLRTHHSVVGAEEVGWWVLVNAAESEALVVLERFIKLNQNAIGA